jgi:hypothetical protein
MDQLPEEIERLIYSMDPTYHRYAWQEVCREIRGECPSKNYDLLFILLILFFWNPKSF